MNNIQVQIIFQLILAVVLGGIIGFEREMKRKQAGLQTYSLVALGACLFTIISSNSFHLFMGEVGVKFDPSRIFVAVATGIGFIGAGIIIFHRDHIQGVTTAAGIWCAAAIGAAIGIKFYLLASFATILVLIIFIVFGKIENKIFSPRDQNNSRI